MKKLLPILPLLLAGPATASIYVNLESGEVTGIKDGLDTVRISNGKQVVQTKHPRARIPAATMPLEDGEEITVPITDAGFKYYSDLYKKLGGTSVSPLKKQPIDYTDPKYGINTTYDCMSKKYSHPSGPNWDVDSCRLQISKKKCKIIREDLFRVKDYPVDGERRVSQWLRYMKDGYCEQSNLLIGCRSGRCYGTPWSGEYGFYPGRWNVISIDGRKWSFRDGLTRQQHLEIWGAIKDGSRFAYQLIHWPYEKQVTGSQTVSLPTGLKDKIYRESLVKP